MHYYSKRDDKKAIELFDKAIEIDDKYAQAWFNKASTHSLLGESESSLSALEKAIQINPEVFKGKAKTDKDFDGVRELEKFKQLVL